LTSHDAERNRCAVIWQSRGQGFESPQLDLHPLPLRPLFLQLNRPDLNAGLINDDRLRRRCARNLERNWSEPLLALTVIAKWGQFF
jgi:hypothetical protein